MEKKYEPSLFEEKIYQRWLNKGYFHAEVDKSKKPFTIIMPPPNITSKLHMGHAFQQTIQDILIRRKRMQGFETLWLPGTDHAAIATEAKVVEELSKRGLTKEAVGRVEFEKYIKEWYSLYKGTIISQFKRMGYSCDWDRLAFTMDKHNCDAVRHAFVHLYKKGYIFRGKRMVNWCCKCKTSISDAEVDMQENHTHLWYLKYEVEGTKNYVTLATTRPETLFGDLAVAVNPNDERYSHLIGKNVIVPIVNRAIPVISDDYVESDFGTGVVKITPCHDVNDFEVGQRHNLGLLNIIDEDGTLNENCGEFAGQDRLLARDGIVKKLKELGYLLKIEDYDNNAGHCDRCKSFIEPLASNQWFVKMKELAKPAIEAVESGKIQFTEERFKKIYLNWMNNIRDWCISRQLWSGHKIPIFTCEDCGEVIVELEDPTHCPKCNSKKLVQETDTLDTWFSSALWPISTLGYPDNTDELNYFYPTDVMVTGYEIIQLWVARMIFSGLEYVGNIPFKTVVINGIVKDENGKKMSKSLGNGVDPIEIIDKYGVDTLRFSLFNGVSIDMDSRFSEKKVELNRNFINKIWNASLYVFSKIENKTIKSIDEVELSDNDKWILHELNNCVKSVNEKFDRFDIGMVASELYEFFWDKYCSWYIEISKVHMGTNKEESDLSVLVYVLSAMLKLLHPFIPFVTEEIYQNLPKHNETIMFEKYPEYSETLEFKEMHATYEELCDLIHKVRVLRKDNNLPDNVKTQLYILPLKNKEFLNNNLKALQKMALGSSITVITDDKNYSDSYARVVNSLAKVFIPNSDITNIDKEIERLTTDLKNADFEIERANRMLNNSSFIEKAPRDMIQKEHEKLDKYIAIKNNIIVSLEHLKACK